jgi:S-adenosylhomocysteine hydrolase
MLAGKVAVVAGFGDVGKGVSPSLMIAISHLFRLEEFVVLNHC